MSKTPGFAGKQWDSFCYNLLTILKDQTFRIRFQIWLRFCFCTVWNLNEVFH